jgi:predicted MPP superfamily phosphohydrolase
LLTRRKFLYAGGLTAAGTAVAGTAGFVQSDRPQVTRIEIGLRRLPASFDGFIIAQLSDFHYEEHFSIVPIRKGVEIVNGVRPDLIVLTGDYVTVPMTDYRRGDAYRFAKNAGPCAALLGRLRAPHGIYAVLGNHDGASDPSYVVNALQGHGIPVLMNRAVPFERDKARIWLTGVDDVLEGRPDLGAALRGVPQNETTILLAHEPDFADEVSFAPVDLQLAGHSHGGQIWIPGIGAPWLPQMARKYPRGLYEIGKLMLYTNLGIGTIRIPVRLNCPPEITLITLRAVQESQTMKIDPNKL